MAKLEIRFDSEEIASLQTPIVVESKERVLGTGSGKRAFKEEFTKTERKRFPYFYKKFYDWYLIHGIPHTGHVMALADWDLTKRFVNFFATH